MRIEDDGSGIAVGQREGVGVTSMRERAEELGGGFRISPAQPHGTVVEVEIPLTQEVEGSRQ